MPSSSEALGHVDRDELPAFRKIVVLYLQGQRLWGKCGLSDFLTLKTEGLLSRRNVGFFLT